MISSVIRFNYPVVHRIIG